MRTITGTVVSTKMAKTIIISTHTYKRHPKYLKKYRTTKKIYAHDENEVCQDGDTVTIRESRPLSKLKRWTVHELNGKAIGEAPKAAPAAETPAPTEAPAITETPLASTEPQE